MQNRIMATQREYSPSQLVEASNYINSNFAGLSFDEVRRRLREEIDALRGDMTQLMQQAVAASTDESDYGETVLISGERNLLEVADLSSDMARLRKLFDIFDQRTSLLQLLGRVEPRAGRADIHRRGIESRADRGNERGHRAV